VSGTEVTATVTKDMLRTGTDASKSIIPPGYVATTNNYWARGHLLASVLGGEGGIPENLVTLVQTGANSPIMRDIEMSVARYIERTGNSVLYKATPIYKGDALIPVGISIEVKGKGISMSVSVMNKPLR